MQATIHWMRGTLFLLVATLFVVTFVSPARAEDAKKEPAAEDKDAPKYTLRYKFKAGEVVRYEVEHRASVRTTIDEVTDEALTKTESTKAWKIIDVLPDGVIELTLVVERVHMRNRLPDRDEMQYDSEKEDASAGL